MISTVFKLSLALLLIGGVAGTDVFAEQSEAARIDASPLLPPYLRSGNQVESRYRLYTKRLGTFYKALRAQVAREAPDLVKKLDPPAPVAYGYQIVPRVAPKKPPAPKSMRVISTKYSWVRTEKLLDGARAKLTGLEERLQKTGNLANSASRATYEAMVASYAALQKNQKLIDRHIKYNRLWQKAVSKEKTRYDRLTRLHGAAAPAASTAMM